MHFATAILNKILIFRCGDKFIQFLLLDVNDNSPSFTQPSFNIHLLENSTKNMCFFQLKAVDFDSKYQPSFMTKNVSCSLHNVI